MHPRNLMWFLFALAFLVACSGGSDKSALDATSADPNAALSLIDVGETNGGRGDEIPVGEFDRPPFTDTADPGQGGAIFIPSDKASKGQGARVVGVVSHTGVLPQDHDFSLGRLVHKGNEPGESHYEIRSNLTKEVVAQGVMQGSTEDIVLETAALYEMYGDNESYLEAVAAFGFSLWLYAGGAPSHDDGGSLPISSGGSGAQATASVAGFSGVSTISAKMDGPSHIWSCVFYAIGLADAEIVTEDITLGSVIPSSANGVPMIGNAETVVVVAGYRTKRDSALPDSTDPDPTCSFTAFETADNGLGLDVIFNSADDTSGNGPLAPNGYANFDTEHFSKNIIPATWLNNPVNHIDTSIPAVAGPSQPSDIVFGRFAGNVCNGVMCTGDEGDVMVTSKDPREPTKVLINQDKFDQNTAWPMFVTENIGNVDRNGVDSFVVKAQTIRGYASQEIGPENDDNLKDYIEFNTKPDTAASDCALGFTAYDVRSDVYPVRVVDRTDANFTKHDGSSYVDKQGQGQTPSSICDLAVADLTNPGQNIAATQIWSADGALADFNGDGLTDILVGTSEPGEHPNILFFNQGTDKNDDGLYEFVAEDPNTVNPAIPGLYTINSHAPVKRVHVHQFETTAEKAANGNYEMILVILYDDLVQPIVAWGINDMGATQIDMLPQQSVPEFDNILLAQTNANNLVDLVGFGASANSDNKIYLGTGNAQCLETTQTPPDAFINGTWKDISLIPIQKSENIADGSPATHCNSWQQAPIPGKPEGMSNAEFCASPGQDVLPALKVGKYAVSTNDGGYMPPGTNLTLTRAVLVND